MCRHVPDEDLAFAMEMQQQEYRQHAMRLAAMQQQNHGNVDVDSMTYEDLSMLGDTVGTVKVSSESVSYTHLTLPTTPYV